MAYASRVGRARVSSKNPQALAICDRCGFVYNHVDLAWQFDWGGASLINKRILVCQPCNDTPQNQLRAIVLPADPTPIMNPRTENFADAETDNITINAPTVTDFWTGIPILPTTTIVTQDGNNVSKQVLGNPTGLDQNAVMPLYDNVKYRVQLFPTSINYFSSSPPSTVTVTFSSPHGLITGNQIAVQGLTNNLADGIYSITYQTATVFTYQVNNVIPVGNLLQGTTLMVTALVGVPYDYAQIPLTGV
jgi:hypothetical protein